VFPLPDSKESRTRSLTTIDQIQEKIALAGRLRDVSPQEALDAVGIVRALLLAPLPQGAAESVVLWQAECALNAAWANVRLGRFVAACPEAEEGLRLFQKLGKPQGAAGCKLVLGIAKGENGENDNALRLCLEAEALFLTIGDQAGRARAINACGTSYRRMGDPGRAIEAYGKSMTVSRDNKDEQGEARALCNIGYVYLYERKYEQAIEYAKRALAMERSLGNLAGELSNCCNLIQAQVAAGRPQEAIDFMAGYDLERLSRSGLFSFLELCQSLSTAYIETGRTADADALLKMGIERARRDKNLRELGSLLCTFARMHRTAPLKAGSTRAGELAAARSALEEALTHGQSRDWDVVQGIQEEFCALCREEGSWNEAFEHLEAAHKIAFKLSSASADERLARQRSEQEAADQRQRAEAEALRHEIERKLLQSQKTESLGVLAGGMVHHFNNLLTSILGNAELAEQDAALVPGALADIKVAGRRAADLCQQIMMYTGRSDHRMAAVDISNLVRESIKLLRVTRVAECEIVCEFPPEPIFVWGDRAELQQIILNLLINSTEAHATAVLFKAAVVRLGPGARAQGEPLEPGEYVELCVTDNGEGMTPEVLARIFEPFYSTRFTGRGLGLPAAMGLVRAHKGTMAVESKPGSGTTVRMHLPVVVSGAVATPKPVTRAAARESRVVLVADDEDMVRKVMVMCMNQLGWTTLEAADGEEAVRVHKEHSGQIDLLLSDYLMPKLNGLEAARQIRISDPGLPVILMSGFTNEATIESFRAAGFEHFLKKPFKIKELVELLEAMRAPVPQLEASL
jgi:signal transduction histidine kinase/CheY-like chemotaxis protein/tetratricopeptide (TPR) repeat protein